MSNFRPIGLMTGFLMPLSVDEWLPKQYLARFVVEVVEKLDRSRMTCAYRGSGSAFCHPAILYFSVANVGRITATIVALNSRGREQHHPG